MKYLFSALLALVLLGTAEETSAQRYYNVALGGRLGPAAGLTVKGFISEGIALEGILSTRFYGPWGLGSGGGNVTFTGLMEWHFPIGRIEGFNWFVGGGAHVGFYNKYYYNSGNKRIQGGGTYIGLDAIGGIEYTLASVPITFQADIKPTIHLVGKGVWFDNIALSVRYAFR